MKGEKICIYSLEPSNLWNVYIQEPIERELPCLFSPPFHSKKWRINRGRVTAKLNGPGDSNQRTGTRGKKRLGRKSGNGGGWTWKVIKVNKDFP